MTDTNSTQEQGNTPTTSVLTWENLKAAGSFLGIVSTGGGGFAALSFGIGYLAIKAHDQMVGIPSVASYTTYVRTGALFFPNSIYYLFSSSAFWLGAVAAIALVIWFVIAMDFKYLPLLTTWREGIKEKLEPATAAWFLFVLANIALIALALCAVNLQVAALHQTNKNLAYKLIAERVRVLESAGDPGTTGATESAGQIDTGGDTGGRETTSRISAFRDAIGLARTSTLAASIERSLRDRDGGQRLNARHGRELLLLLLLAYGTYGVRWWRARLPDVLGTAGAASGKGFRLPIVDWVVHPVLYALVLATLVNLPASYGILCLSNSGAEVSLIVSDTGEKPRGYLLSDLSSGDQELWLLAREGDTIALRVFDRSALVALQFTSNWTPNILALEFPG